MYVTAAAAFLAGGAAGGVATRLAGLTAPVLWAVYLAALWVEGGEGEGQGRPGQGRAGKKRKGGGGSGGIWSMWLQGGVVHQVGKGSIRVACTVGLPPVNVQMHVQ